MTHFHFWVSYCKGQKKFSRSFKVSSFLLYIFQQFLCLWVALATEKALRLDNGKAESIYSSSSCSLSVYGGNIL